jgi:small subunit ribosomal protein S3
LGQKVNPLGFRLVTIQKPKSNWFSKLSRYPELLEEDTKIRNFLEKINHLAGITNIEINRNSNCNKIEIIISSCLPSYLLGKKKDPKSKLKSIPHTSNVKSIYESLEKIILNKRIIIVKLTVINNPSANATLISYFIVSQLEKRVKFGRILKKAIEKAQTVNVSGIKVQISGRLNGANIARTKWIRQGRLPLHTLTAEIDYAQNQAITIYGIMGVKVWLFKDEVLYNF